jgi:hypothetical protein
LLERRGTPSLALRWLDDTQVWQAFAVLLRVRTVAGAGLKNIAQAKRIAIDGTGRTVIDGPFAEARELVAGFSIWEVKDMDEAVAWAKRCPSPMPGPSEIEIRPSYEAADLAEFLTPEELSTPRDGDRGKLGVA